MNTESWLTLALLGVGCGRERDAIGGDGGAPDVVAIERVGPANRARPRPVAAAASRARGTSRARA